MRLTNAIIAICLVVSMAIFPISMGQGAGMAAPGHAGALASAHGPAGVAVTAHAHDQDASVGHTHEPDHGAAAVHAQASDDAAEAAQDCVPSDEGGPSCCAIGACHVFEVGLIPGVSTPVSAGRLLRMTGDAQVAGRLPFRIDRPPRTA